MKWRNPEYPEYPYWRNRWCHLSAIFETTTYSGKSTPKGMVTFRGHVAHSSYKYLARPKVNEREREMQRNVSYKSTIENAGVKR